MLDFIQARHAVKALLPTLSERDVRYVISHLYYQVRRSLLPPLRPARCREADARREQQ